MVLYLIDDKIIKKIIGSVAQKPRTIQEVAQLLRVNWRTADRYVQLIAKERGTLATRVFREGTRGALKVVYCQTDEKINSTEFQERLFQRILLGRKKEDFSPLDIYQYVDEKKRRAFLETQKEEFATIEQDVISLLMSATKQVFIFSGNLSWATVKQGKQSVRGVLLAVAKRGIPIKILTRIDIASEKNLLLVNEINEELGRTAIEIRHCEQPLRAIVIDSTQARLKELKAIKHYKSGELEKNTFIFYDLFDPDWNEWLVKVFWHLFQTAVPAKKRIDIISSLKKL